MIEWLWNSLVGFALGAIPTWVWIVAAGVAIGWAWKTFGWQGVAGGALAVLTLGAYRQGWRDRDGRDRHEQVDEDSSDARPSPPKPKRPSIKRPTGKRVYDPDTNSWK